MYIGSLYAAVNVTCIVEVFTVLFVKDNSVFQNIVYFKE